MRKLFLTSTVFLFMICQLKSQLKHDYVWLLGIPEVITPSINGINIVDFNEGQLTITETNFNMHFYVCNASMSDAQGNLIFYSNGCRIHDVSHQVMENGDKLNPGFFWQNQCEGIYGAYPTSKGMVVLPRPGHPDEYWLFHNSGIFGETGPYQLYSDRLYYTVVDMTLNGGLGAVTAKNQVLVQDTLANGSLSAVKHANGEDWWVMMAKEPDRGNAYFKVLFTAGGIAQIDTQYIGSLSDGQASAGGQGQFSPDGTKYGWYSKRIQGFLYDFDRSTGQLSNFRNLYVDTTEGHWGSLCFSPSGRYLYVGTQVNLWQFDTWAADVEASKVHIDSFDGYISGVLPSSFSYMQVAPDCKIYMVTVSGTDVLHVIHQPDLPGKACDFRQHDIILPAFNSASSQPNFPNYRLGTPYPLCDSSIVYVPTRQVVWEEPELRVYPNPASDYLAVGFSQPAAAGTAVVHDLMGRQVLEQSFVEGSEALLLDTSRLPAGSYILSVQAGSSFVSRLFVVSR